MLKIKDLLKAIRDCDCVVIQRYTNGVHEKGPLKGEPRWEHNDLHNGFGRNIKEELYDMEVDEISHDHEQMWIFLVDKEELNR